MSAIDIAIGALITLLFASGIGMWGLVITRKLRGESIVEQEPRVTPPWCIADLFLILVILFALQLAAYAIARELAGVTLAKPLTELTPDGRAMSLLIGSTTQLITVVASILIVRVRNTASLEAIGLSFRRFTYDLRLGLATFLLLGPIALLIQLIATQFSPSTHPLIELIKAEPELRFAILGTFTAVIAAPISEEFAMRGMLQGLVERISLTKHDAMSLLFGFSIEPETTPVQTDGEDDAKPSEYSNGYGDETPLNPYAAPSPTDDHTDDKPSTDTDFRPAIWPVFVSSLLFALLHWSHGPDWIALFIFALGLGYVTHRTGRLLPAIVAHMLLNGWSILMLVLSVASGA